MSVKILVVEDEAAIREMLTMALERASFEVVTAATGDKALSIATDEQPDLIVLDWMLPGMSGIQVARQFKSRLNTVTKEIPIIMLTARGDEDDKILGLDSGADDYMTKPFSPKELVARIKAVLRRVSPMSEDQPLDVAGLSLDPVSHRATANSAPIELGPTEFKLLHFFLTHQERVYSRSQLLDNVWGANVYVAERTVDVHIRRLRKALEPSMHHKYIQTVRGAGYRFSNKV